MEPLLFVGEDGFNGGIEETGEFEGEGKGWVIFAGFDGVDGLPRDFETLCEIGLAPIALGAEDTETVLHLYLRRMIG